MDHIALVLQNYEKQCFRSNSIDEKVSFYYVAEVSLVSRVGYLR